MKIQLPEKVNTIIQTLQEHGYEAYAVGGCVRDSLLGREPGDWDITTQHPRMRQRNYLQELSIPGLSTGQ